MKKKYYDAPQMEIFKLETMTVLAGSGDKDMGIDPDPEHSVDNGQSLAGQFFGGDDGGEDW